MRHVARVLAAVLVVLPACSDSSETHDQIAALEERVIGLEQRNTELETQLTEVLAALGVATSVATTTTVAPTSTTTVAPGPELGLTRVPHDELVFGGPNNQAMSGVVLVAGVGLVAFGSDDSGGDWDAAVWTSPTGVTWTRIPNDEAIFGGVGNQEMGDMVMGGAGLIAVGYDDSGGDGDVAVWSSPDGVTWTRVPHDEAILGGPDDQAMSGVVLVAGVGLVAVGYDGSGGDWDAAVWTSSGAAGTRVPHDEAIFGGPGNQAMYGVVVAGVGLVAVGYDDSGGDGDAAVWTSPDGVTWTRVPHDEEIFGGPGDQSISGVGVLGTGLVAVGYDAPGGDFDAAVWISPDGVSWTRVPHDEEIFGGIGLQAVTEVVAAGGAPVAFGYDYSGGDGDVAVWASPDGVTWTRVPHDEVFFGGPGNQRIRSVMVTRVGLFAVGYDDAGGDMDAAVWTSLSG